MRKPILTIFYQFNPWHTSIGGIQTIIKYFIKYAPDNFEVRLVGTSIDSETPREQWQETTFEGRSLKFFPLILAPDDNIRRPIPTTLRYTWAIRRHCLASDFMHFHRIEPTLATSNWKGEKTLFIHNDIQQQMASRDDKNSILWQKFPSLYFGLERLLIPQFDQIYSCNSKASAFYQHQYPFLSNRINFFQNAVDPEIFYPLPDPVKAAKKQALCLQLSLPPDTEFLLFSGRLHPQKDPILLLHAIAALQHNPVNSGDHHKPFHLLMVGEGELKSKVAAEIKRLGLSQQVSLMGSYPLDQLANLYQLCCGFVLSSVYEGLPLTVLEALACGVPVVTTPSGETTHFLSRETGIIVENRTPEAIAQALTQVLQCPEKFSSEACVRLAQSFNAKTVIATVYEQMFERWIAQVP